MFLYDIAIPEMSLILTYQSNNEIKTGVRVSVKVQEHSHTGFNLGSSKNDLSSEIEIKNVENTVDEKPIITPDLWDMILYAGHISLRGAAVALRVILPRPLIMGDKFSRKGEILKYNPKNFREIDFFNPIDSVRFDFYLNELKSGKRTLILFSQKKTAKIFFDSLPEEIKNRALLWNAVNGAKYYFPNWLLTNEGKFDFIIGSAGAIFAPMMFEKIIIEDEGGKSFMIPPFLNISAVTLAGRRAAFSGAKLIIGGRQPSLKTFIRSKPEEKILPNRENIILADIFHRKTFKEEITGIDGNIPLTFSLIKNTYRELIKKNSVIWILDRLGESSEVYCPRCGENIKCPKCGNNMRSEDNGKKLRCVFCGKSRDLPPKCEKCGFEVLSGKRPGLEALEKIAAKYYDKVVLYTDKYSRLKKNSLILSTSRGLELCEKLKPSLIAWLDLDLELSFSNYDNNLGVFNLLYESYWRGREKNSERKILIQARNYGMNLAQFLHQGWSSFFPVELSRRKEFTLPPFGYVIELETQNIELREKLFNAFSDAEIFVMDPGDESEPLNITTESLEPVSKVLNSLKIPPKELKITMQN